MFRQICRAPSGIEIGVIITITRCKVIVQYLGPYKKAPNSSNLLIFQYVIQWSYHVSSSCIIMCTGICAFVLSRIVKAHQEFQMDSSYWNQLQLKCLVARKLRRSENFHHNSRYFAYLDVASHHNVPRCPRCSQAFSSVTE